MLLAAAGTEVLAYLYIQVCKKIREEPAHSHNLVGTFISVTNSPLTYIAQTEQWWQRSGFISWHLSQNRIPVVKDTLIANNSFFCLFVFFIFVNILLIFKLSIFFPFISVKDECICSWDLLPGHNQISNARSSRDLYTQGTLLTAKHAISIKPLKCNCTLPSGFSIYSDFQYIPCW